MKKYLLLAIMLATIMPLVFAATEITSPIESGNYSGTVNLTVTTDITKPLNCTFVYNADGDPALTLMVQIINTTDDQVSFSDGAFDISEFSTAATYNISANCSGDTGEVAEAVTLITFDSINPACTFNRDHRTMAWKGVQLVTWTSSDDLDLRSTSMIIDRPQDGADMTYTDANKELTLTSQDTKYLGSWSAKLGAMDSAGNLCNETLSWKTYLPDRVGEDGEPAKIPGLLIVVVIIGVIYFISKK